MDITPATTGPIVLTGDTTFTPVGFSDGDSVVVRISGALDHNVTLGAGLVADEVTPIEWRTHTLIEFVEAGGPVAMILRGGVGGSGAVGRGNWGHVVDGQVLRLSGRLRPEPWGRTYVSSVVAQAASNGNAQALAFLAGLGVFPVVDEPRPEVTDTHKPSRLDPVFDGSQVVVGWEMVAMTQAEQDRIAAREANEARKAEIVSTHLATLDQIRDAPSLNTQQAIAAVQAIADSLGKLARHTFFSAIDQ